MGSNGNGEAVAAWEEEGLGVRQRKGGAVAAGAGVGTSSSFAEGMGEFVLRSMDEKFSGSADIDELFTSSRQSGSCLVEPFGLFCARCACECATISVFSRSIWPYVWSRKRKY